MFYLRLFLSMQRRVSKSMTVFLSSVLPLCSARCSLFILLCHNSIVKLSGFVREISIFAQSSMGIICDSFCKVNPPNGKKRNFLMIFLQFFRKKPFSAQKSEMFVAKNGKQDLSSFQPLSAPFSPCPNRPNRPNRAASKLAKLLVPP